MVLPGSSISCYTTYIMLNRLLQQFWNVAGAAPIRVKVLGIVVGVIVLLGGFIIIQMQAVMTEQLLDGITHQGVALSADIAIHLTELHGANQAQVDSLLDQLKEHYRSASHNTDVLYILIEDERGQLIAGTAGSTAQPPLTTLQADPYNVERSDDGSSLQINRALSNNAGVLRIGIGTERIHDTVNTVTLQLFSITLVMVAVGFAAAFFLTWILTRPLLDLLAATQAVAQGDFSRRVQRWANDEIGDLVDAFNRMTASLQQAEAEREERDQLRRHYVNAVITAQENERQRIARELHDSTGQSLTSLLIGLQNLKRLPAGEELDGHIDELREVITASLDDVRGMAWRLRPSALDDLGLLSALEHYLEEYRARYDIQVELVASGLDGRLSLDIETAIYRIVQEGLTNIARHARSSSASVIINRRNHLIRVIIEDKGIGFDPTTVGRSQYGSLGLQGIRERAELLKGQLTIELQPGQGTTLYIEIPDPTNEEDNS